MMAKAPSRNARVNKKPNTTRSRRKRTVPSPSGVHGLRLRFFLPGVVGSGPPTCREPLMAVLGGGAGWPAAGGLEVTDSEGLGAALIAVSTCWEGEWRPS